MLKSIPIKSDNKKFLERELENLEEIRGCPLLVHLEDYFWGEEKLYLLLERVEGFTLDYFFK